MSSIAFLRERYNFNSDKDVIDLIKDKLEQINYEDLHARTVNGTWAVDDEGVKILDSILSYKDEQESPDADDTEQTELDGEMLRTEITHLKETLISKDGEIAELTDKLNSVNEKFLSLKDGSDEMTSNIVKEYLSRKEKAEEKLKAAKERYTEQLALREKHISELEEQIEEYQKKLDEYSSILAEKTKAVFEVFQSKNVEKKLYADIRRVEKERCELYQDLSNANNKIDETVQLNEHLIIDISAAINNLTAIAAQLQKTVDENEGKIHINMEKSEADDETSIQDRGEETEDEAEKDNVTSIDAHRQQLIDKARQEQKEADQKGTSIFRRIASFFSFF